MKQYKEIHHERGNDEGGAFAWVNPKEVRTVTLEDKHAEDIQAQFPNTGIQLEPVEDEAAENEPEEQAPSEVKYPAITPQSEQGGESAPLASTDIIPESEKDNNESDANL